MSVWADFTLAELRGLRTQILQSRGQSQTRFADRSVAWSSEAERRQLLKELTDEIADRDGTARVRRLRVDSQKGFI